MMKFKRFFNVLLAGATILVASSGTSVGNNNSKDNKMETSGSPIKEEQVIYNAGGISMKGFVAYDSSTAEKRPVVLVVPEWWGLNDYSRSRVKQLAQLGYLAMAVDMYGNGAVAPDPESAGKMAKPFYEDPQLGKTRFDAALARVKTYAIADTAKIAAIGYCFGGAQVINVAKLGDHLQGVVSFHGNLTGVPADKKLLTTPILVCHGEADQFVKPEEVAMFKKQMDSIGAAYTFKSFPGATHAFTNPDATRTGERFKMPIAYNAAADKASWNDMKDFFAKIFK